MSKLHVLRGGAVYYSGAVHYNRELARCAAHYGCDPDHRFIVGGFRVVVSRVQKRIEENSNA